VDSATDALSKQAGRVMDDPNRHRRQNEPPVHASSNPRFPIQDPSQQQHQHHPEQQQQRRTMASSASERFRPAPLNTSAARGMGAAGSYSGYYGDSSSTFSGTGLPQSAMSYQSTDYGQDARQTQSFGAYNPNMMYPVGQTNTQNPYDATQQFQQRQPAQLQMMSADVPQYFQSDTGSAASAGSALQSSAQASSATAAASLYQQSQIPGYSSNLPSVGNVGSTLGTAQPTTGDVSMTEADYSTGGNAMEERMADYNARLATVFRDIRSGTLERASEVLLNLSNWLLNQVVDLGKNVPISMAAPSASRFRRLTCRDNVVGLNVDDRNQHADRIKMWNDFNHAWLGLLQRQKDMLNSGQQLQRSQSLITKDDLEKLGKELVRLCDGVERYGLVDYQYGVWEERIVAGEFEPPVAKSTRR